MSATSSELLAYMARLRSADAPNRVKNLRDLDSFGPLLTKPYITKADEARSFWQMRYENKDITGVIIPGAPALIRKLKQLKPDTEIDQFGFTGDKLVGCIFFHHHTGEFLGETIIERRPKSQAMRELEAELGIVPPAHAIYETAELLK